MVSEYGHLVCAFFECRRRERSCVCTRCGRVQHDWNNPVLIDSSFELVGVDKKRKMLYAQVERYRYTCTRCGATELKDEQRRVTH